MLSVQNFKRQVANHQYHLLNPYDGILVHRFECVRCKRDLPDTSFFPLMKAERLNGVGSRANIERLIVLNGVCLACRAQQRGKWVKHPLYSPGLDRHFADYLRLVRAGAISRGLFFGLDKDDLLGLYIRQEGKCNLTGIRMAWESRGKKGRGNRAPAAPSLDRIDSDKDYTLDNVQMVLQIVNTMKSDLPQSVFIEVCQSVITHRFGSTI